VSWTSGRTIWSPDP